MNKIHSHHLVFKSQNILHHPATHFTKLPNVVFFSNICTKQQPISKYTFSPSTNSFCHFSSDRCNVPVEKILTEENFGRLPDVNDMWTLIMSRCHSQKVIKLNTAVRGVLWSSRLYTSPVQLTDPPKLETNHITTTQCYDHF